MYFVYDSCGDLVITITQIDLTAMREHVFLAEVKKIESALRVGILHDLYIDIDITL